MNGVAVGLVVVAAGSGARLGAEVPKAFVEVGGRSLLAHGCGRLAAGADRVVVVAPADWLGQARAILDAARISAEVVAGGRTRTESVAAGLDALGACQIVAVHDAARPLVDLGALDRSVAAVHGGADAAAPALPMTDTVKVVAEDGRTVTATLDRTWMRTVQTPQVFRHDVLLRAHAQAVDGATDDLALVEQLGADVVLVAGDARYLKVTHPHDLDVVRALLGAT